MGSGDETGLDLNFCFHDHLTLKPPFIALCMSATSCVKHSVPVKCKDSVWRKYPILERLNVYLLQIFPDNACRREILHLEVYCEYMVNGCSWIGALRDLDVSTSSDVTNEMQDIVLVC